MEEREDGGGAVRVGMVWGGIGGVVGLLASLPGSLIGILVSVFYRVLLRETGGRGGKTVGGALRIDRRGRRRAGVCARVYTRGAPGGAPDRGGRDRRYSLGDPRYAGLRRPGLDLLPGQPHSLRHPRSRYPGLGLISRRSLDEEGVKRIAYYPLAASAACSPKTKSSSSGRVTPARSRRRSFWYFLIAAFRVPRPRVAHLGREATTWRPS